MDKIKLVVFNEYALGYIMPEQPDKVCTLADSVLRGAPFRVMNEPYYIGSKDTVRLAGKQDFETFRVVFDGYDSLTNLSPHTSPRRKAPDHAADGKRHSGRGAT